MAHILLVEDSDALRMVMRTYLEADHLRVLEASDGKSALLICEKLPAIDLIITDQNMPELNGMDMLREIRKIPQYAKVPVIFHTTENDKEMKREAEALGVTGWLVKPAGPKNLKVLIHKILSSTSPAP